MSEKRIKKDTTTAAFVHLSTFSQLFLPLGNFILPLVLWMSRKEDQFVQEHGKQALNFQISLYLYTMLLGFIGVAGMLFMMNHLGMEYFLSLEETYEMISKPELIPILYFLLVIFALFLGLFILNLYGVISATLKASEGAYYNYPVTINFIPSSPLKNLLKMNIPKILKIPRYEN